VLAVKAQATRQALAFISPKLAPAGFIVSAQNGLNELTIAEAVGEERTIGCFVNFSADYLEPGLIHFGGPGAFYIGELNGRITDRLKQVGRDFSHWKGGKIQTTENIWGFLWGKQGYGAMLYATALTNDSMADALDRNREVVVAIAREVLTVAVAEGVQPLGFDGYEPEVLQGGTDAEINASMDRIIAIRKGDEKTHSGIWRDLAVRKRKTEVNAHFNPILSLSKKHGLVCPLLTRMVEMIHEIEEGKRSFSQDNLDELNHLL
jgi:2-dehydropantoate 2-reductase